jgi:heme-degrading monooxygenase HmoA
MYTVLRRYTLTRGSTKELARDVQAQFLPRINRLEGFISYELVAESDKALTSISVFETEAGARESTRVAEGYVREIADRFVLERREVFDGELLVHQEATIGAGR